MFSYVLPFLQPKFLKLSFSLSRFQAHHEHTQQKILILGHKKKKKIKLLKNWLVHLNLCEWNPI